MDTERIFLLSPARAGGRRYSYLVREGAAFDLAIKFREGRATVGEVYSFISGLYFRGKLAYAEAFAKTALVIVPGRGLISPETLVTMDELRATAEVDVHEENPVYTEALVRAAKELDDGKRCYVLLGSVASGKYTGPLLEIFGERLLFPKEFVGRGDMSRGGLMLRSARTGKELSYMAVKGAIVRGVRPPRLERETPPPKS